MFIKLTSMEMMIASSLGTARHMQSLTRTPRHEQPKDDSLNAHIFGAMGEMAAAKAMGIYPGFTVNTFGDAPDMGDDIQVRTSKTNRLIVREHDNDDQKFVLVTGNAPEMDVIGWVYGREAKHDKWFTDNGNGRPPAWFVPASELRPIGGIRAW